MGLLNARSSFREAWCECCGAIAFGDHLQPLNQATYDSIYVRKNNVLLAFEMKIHSALADSRFFREIIYCHFRVAIPRQQPIRGVKDDISSRFIRTTGVILTFGNHLIWLTVI